MAGPDHDPPAPSPDARRPLKSRSTRWAAHLSTAAVRAGLTADSISIASLLCAAAGSAALLWWRWPWGLLACAAGIQLRLLCNLLDGMVAVEGGCRSKVGALYNEVPDRIADSMFLVALGYAVGLDWLGWLAALAAALTAYIRVLGGTLGLAQDFRGPQAKPHRMAVMTLACLLGVIEWAWRSEAQVLRLALWVIAIGALLTCGTRLLAIARQLRAR
ncbi:MAG: CDP-alcohol phosphatidyltransferase family protein [Sinobacteraceae bacterium]|nr:CDP-alcohol phosphatidyltransferase family protein [Nevskiaceae bacterium]MCP5339247.1 CDP-alcohol phosphatidyltransferase family protein [Nevskiaceae bacterium]MCP5359404.1 CDP-alcohol phosphatidyltransferase family protein [Nevskiaceae bacterium]MCP5467325.1 CDP-alcohol phosphatidyltransferase family protein [Nevskiaceae bacterium]MCP5470843.1 CDP-alcohol phosphatidyltransferase family protein [Nevskiaceae bacterium]